MLKDTYFSYYEGELEDCAPLYRVELNQHIMARCALVVHSLAQFGPDYDKVVFLDERYITDKDAFVKFFLSALNNWGNKTRIPENCTFINWDAVREVYGKVFLNWNAELLLYHQVKINTKSRAHMTKATETFGLAQSGRWLGSVYVSDEESEDENDND